MVEVGGPGTLGQSLRAVRHGGEITSVDFLAAERTKIDFLALSGSRATFRPISVGSRANLRELATVTAAAGVAPVIDRVFDLNDARTAFETLAEADHVGKLVVRVA